MGIELGVSLIIVGLFAASVLAYILTKVNKQLGAWVTVVGSFAALVVMYLLQGDIGSTYKLFFLEFTLTQYGWFFSVIMLAVFACVSFFNIYWMQKIIHPAAYNMLYMLALMGTIGAFAAKDFIGLFIFWETIVWSSMFIIPFGKSRKASVVYYAFSAFGSLSMLYGILFLYGKFGSFEIASVLKMAAGDPTAALVAFITIELQDL